MVDISTTLAANSLINTLCNSEYIKIWEVSIRFSIRLVHFIGSNVTNSIRFALFVVSDFFDSIGRIVECRIFDIRSTLLRIGFSRFDRPHIQMSNIRQPKHPSSDVGLSTFDQPLVECRIFDIRSTLLRIGFFRFDRPDSSNNFNAHSFKWYE